MPLGQIMSPKVFLSNQLASIPCFYLNSKLSKIRLGVNPGFGLELEVMKIARMGRPTLKTSRSPKISRSISTYLDQIFFYKALEKDKNRFGEKLAVPGVTVKRRWQRNQVGEGVCSVLGRVASEYPTFNDGQKHLFQIIYCPKYFIFIQFRPE